MEYTAYLEQPEPNSTYLSCTGYKSTDSGLSNPVMGLMMLVSTFQYQAPYVNPVYSTAMSQAGKAAFIESGEADTENKLIKIVTSNGKDALNSIGLTETELGVFLGTIKTLRSRQIEVNGPQIYSLRTKLTMTQGGGSIGLGVKF